MPPKLRVKKLTEKNLPGRLLRARHYLQVNDQPLSQREAGETIGVDRKTYNRWECGHRFPRSKFRQAAIGEFLIRGGEERLD